MTLRYLLDTTICIFIIKNKPAAVRERFAGLRPGAVGLSAVTEAELLHGVYKSARIEHNLAAVLDFASQLVVVPFDSQVADAYGRIRAELEKAGQPIGPLDFQIAATAVAHGLILVTNNTCEFARVPDLKIEDWTL
ncbi:type II toxin-antitoxin system VapC family toxin [Deinococcus sp. SDU3-2]|uniref:Ribonuclease VapC n=1 Tax=Deinococcus terrestris TaxID=2651870 RepID=A0A7X1NYN5_9DEIO|nr:type II toxin-antitoxin system VapC family toxin [Deinococcus terrestris]MPY68148.1 type II toxin-antitoxin system VapC family toxin [Deinococcus terrestris]